MGRPYPDHRNSPWGPKKDPKIKSKLKVRIEENIEQAGAELGKAQPKLGLGKIKINLALV